MAKGKPGLAAAILDAAKSQGGGSPPVSDHEPMGLQNAMADLIVALRNGSPDEAARAFRLAVEIVGTPGTEGT